MKMTKHILFTQDVAFNNKNALFTSKSSSLNACLKHNVIHYLIYVHMVVVTKNG